MVIRIRQSYSNYCFQIIFFKARDYLHSFIQSFSNVDFNLCAIKPISKPFTIFP